MMIAASNIDRHVVQVKAYVVVLIFPNVEYQKQQQPKGDEELPHLREDRDELLQLQLQQLHLQLQPQILVKL